MERFLTHSTSWRLLALAISVGLGAISGCSGSPYDMASVTGKVTIDGQPFAQGKVMFAPIAAGKSSEAGRPAFGRLQSDGSFELGTYEPGDGAVVGEHWVTVIRIDPETDQDDQEASRVAPPSAALIQFSRIAVPTKVIVSADQDNVIDVVLTKADLARYASHD